jgi:hypothetical protein
MLCALVVAAGLACGEEPDTPPGARVEDVQVGFERVLQDLDPATTLVTHGIASVDETSSSALLHTARKAAEAACAWAQTEVGKRPLNPKGADDEGFVLERNRFGTEQAYGLELARHVAACYAREMGAKQADTGTRLLFLSVASECASRRGATAAQMSQLMLALFDSQGLSMAAYVNEHMRVGSQPLFRDYLQAAIHMCPVYEISPADVSFLPDWEKAEGTESNAVGERVYLGILRGRVPGRIKLKVKRREVEAEVTIFKRKIRVVGKLGRFNTLVLNGKLRNDTIELRGKFKARGRKIRGRYNGKIRFPNQPRPSRATGFWEANLEE